MVPWNGKWNLPGVEDPVDIISKYLKKDSIFTHNENLPHSVPSPYTTQYKVHSPEPIDLETSDEPVADVQRYIHCLRCIYFILFSYIYFL